MKKTASIVFTIILISMFSCKPIENCDDIDCVNPTDPIYIELIDMQTNVNVFASGILSDSSQFIIVNSDFENQKFTLLQESYLIEIPNITNIPGPTAYQIIIRNDYIVTFQVDNQTITEEDCCKTFYVRKFRVSTLPYEFDKQSLVAQIYVNLE